MLHNNQSTYNISRSRKFHVMSIILLVNYCTMWIYYSPLVSVCPFYVNFNQYYFNLWFTIDQCLIILCQFQPVMLFLYTDAPVCFSVKNHNSRVIWSKSLILSNCFLNENASFILLCYLLCYEKLFGFWSFSYCSNLFYLFFNRKSWFIELTMYVLL